MGRVAPTVGSALLLLALLSPQPAAAFDFFGLFGSDDTPPAVSEAALPYAITYDVQGRDAGDDSDVVQALRDASTSYKLRHDAPATGDTLARRLQADADPMLDALWALGYYNATTSVVVGSASLDATERALEDVERTAETFRNRTVVPVTIHVELGPLFHLAGVAVAYPRQDAPDGLPRLAFRLKAGDVARSSDIRAAQVRLVDWFRARGHPLAKVGEVKARVDHAAATMDLTLAIASGPAAGFGAVSITGTTGIDPAVVASHVYIQESDPYSPDRIVETRKSIARIQAIGGIRIREADKLDANGNLPVFVDVSERPLHVVGASARYSTRDGPGITSYWEDRNIFGGGERLRLEGDVSLLQRIDGTQYHGLSGIKASDFGERLNASFVKPALFGTRNDLLVDAGANRERVGNNTYGGYTSRAVGTTIGVIHRFSDTASAQAGVQYEKSVSTDVLGRVDATLVGLTTAVRYDSSDDLLNPTRGIRAVGSINVYPKAVGSSVDLAEGRIAASTYYAIDEDADYVLAGRLALGSLLGPALAAIPAAHRFYSGGGGSVRGFTYRTISPTAFGQITGGRSLFESAAEVRVKITPTIGIVPFIDVGGAFRASVPTFNDYVGIGAGLGLRYLTPIGPIRFDVATPVNRRPGDGVVAIYVSIGQAF